ncbi:MAG TPA: Fur family transcriptional regulator [Paludibacteraceae bacterium]|nr:Fur family transcriptional regulator [Paludibacteraceae bacterium]
MKEDKSFEAVKQGFTDFMVKNNLRKTRERYAILESIYKHTGHFNAELLFNQMPKEYQVSLATVYNTLDLLQQCHLIVKHQFGEQGAQFEKTFGIAFHHHLVCTECGKIREFPDLNINTLIQKKKFPRFETTRYSLYVYGLCNKCIAQQKKAGKH